MKKTLPKTPAKKKSIKLRPVVKKIIPVEVIHAINANDKPLCGGAGKTWVEVIRDTDANTKIRDIISCKACTAMLDEAKKMVASGVNANEDDTTP